MKTLPAFFAMLLFCLAGYAQKNSNVVFIYVDDLGKIPKVILVLTLHWGCNE